MDTQFNIKISVALKAVIEEEARKAGLRQNEYVAKVLAELFGKPALAEIPRLTRVGRPPKCRQVAVSA